MTAACSLFCATYSLATGGVHYALYTHYTKGSPERVEPIQVVRSGDPAQIERAPCGPLQVIANRALPIAYGTP